VEQSVATRVRTTRQMWSLQNTCPYGYSMPVAVRYTHEAFQRYGWLWLIYAKGEMLRAFFFFFSSRRRHTRFDCDWSSDVCSSDLQRACRGVDRPLADGERLPLYTPR